LVKYNYFQYFGKERKVRDEPIAAELFRLEARLLE
jgi:hypothetical protein